MTRFMVFVLGSLFNLKGGPIVHLLLLPTTYTRGPHALQQSTTRSISSKLKYRVGKS